VSSRSQFVYSMGLLSLLGLVLPSSIWADTVTISGQVTQSTSDGTGPAVNNPSLNDIQDGDTYSVSLDFSSSVASPGTYTDFTAADFADLTSPADESSFSSVSLTILPPSGGLDEFSVLGCLSTGEFGCGGGNQLDLNFIIPADLLNGENAAAQSVPFLTPLDLLEDDGATDIQGNVAGYSYTPAVGVTPEPSSFLLFVSGSLALALLRLKRRRSPSP